MMNAEITTRKVGSKWHGYLAGRPDLDETALTEEAARRKMEQLRDRIGVCGAKTELFGGRTCELTVVCATARTSDYWQGDEAKWQRAYDDGRGGTFIDRPKFDESANRRIAQISVPVMDGEKVIGAITVGVAIEKLK